jgi:type II restriction enzyme
VAAYQFCPACGARRDNNVRPKIRQQLQVLRDRGWTEFVGRGRYRLRSIV